MSAAVLIVAVCSVIQGVFGVGLLVFGTPCLLLMGFDFTQALFYLLPCSMAVSLLQIREGAGHWQEPAREYARYLLPAAALGAAFIYLSGAHIGLRVPIGVMLIVSAVLRVSAAANRLMGRHMAVWSKAAMVFIGLIHGLTNMGGGLLAVFVGVRSSDKSIIRTAIASGYLMMAAVQWSLLMLIMGARGEPAYLALLLVVTVCGYHFAARRIFRGMDQPVFEHAMTALIATCGALLLFK